MDGLDASLAKAITHLKGLYAKLQIGTANAGLFDDVLVPAYGSDTPIKNVANVSCPDAKTVAIEPWDKSIIGDIEKAILAANIGFNPQNMGEKLLCPVPPMTEDRRRDMVKVVKTEAEEAKISVRNIRQDVLKKVQGDEFLSDDEKKRSEKQVQEKIDAANKEIDTLAKSKEAEIMKV